MTAMTWAQVRRHRLRRHWVSIAAKDPATIARDVCGVHAQVMAAAELAIGIRLASATRTDVRQALWRDRALVKTYGPRGTVHLFAAEELGLWMGALAAAYAPSSGLPPPMRLTDEQSEAIVEAIGSALAEATDGLTIEELDREVVERAGAWAGERVMPAFTDQWPLWRRLLGLAAYRGVLCFGPARGRRVTYTSPRSWVPGFEPAGSTAGSLAGSMAGSPAGEAALAEVALRYLDTYGPATPHQFAQWFGMNRARATRLFAALGDRLRQVTVDGSAAWLRAGDDESPAGEDGVRLVPYFDPYVVGCHPRELLFPGQARDRALFQGGAGIVPVLLVDGVVAGVWHHRRSGRRLAMTVEPFTVLGAAGRRELAERVERIGTVLEATPELTIGTVRAGKHL